MILRAERTVGPGPPGRACPAIPTGKVSPVETGDGGATVSVGVPRETFPGERRVALVPATVQPLVEATLRVLVEAGAGLESGFADEAYAERGASIVPRADALAADAVLQVRTLGANPEAGRDDLDVFRRGQIVIGMSAPLSEPEAVRSLAERGVTLFAMELIPRISRAQGMDVLSAQATIAGYKAVLLAADALPKMFPMLTTAAGTVAPARVFVIGAGVAGLQAIATARRLGAVVEAYDVRPAVKEQVESLGAKFVELPLEAAEAGGNCELTRADQVVEVNGVRILGPTNLPSTIPFHASQMYSKNVSSFLLHLVHEGRIELDLEDEITRETLAGRDGEVVHPRIRKALGLEDDRESKGARA